MPRKCYRAEEIIHKLREAEAAFSQAKATAEVCNQLALPSRPSTAGGVNPVG